MPPIRRRRRHSRRRYNPADVSATWWQSQLLWLTAGASLGSAIPVALVRLEDVAVLLAGLMVVLGGLAWLAQRELPPTTRPQGLSRHVPPRVVGAGMVAGAALVGLALLTGRLRPAEREAPAAQPATASPVIGGQTLN